MKQTSIVFLLFVIFSINPSAQSFREFISTLPELNIPVKWSEKGYFNWPEVDLPQNLFATAGIDLYSGKALATINFRSHYLVLVKEFYSYKNDFLIYGLLYKADGTFNKLITLRNAAEGGNLNFYISEDLELKIMDSDGGRGSLSTFAVQNDGLIAQGYVIDYEVADDYMENEDNQ
ncbi:MAG: hypothetical protein O2887_00030 [Bacteroidetes bacterium]|nr:hypothetical protein [Bacteroidota bacterium]MDA1118878.1 hypothetical protein [Bacteroidota bacterium]